MSSADIVVLRGRPDAEELAALVVVLRMLTGAEEVPPPRQEDSAWRASSGWRSAPHGGDWRTAT